MREQTTRLLGDIVRKYNPREILEIGTGEGVSGITALANCTGRLTTIDIDEDAILRAKENLEKCNLRPRCEFILGDCVEVISLMDNRYDFVILDGPKGQYAKIYELLFPMLEKGGIIFADDIKYLGLVEKDGTPAHKHRTIVNTMRRFIDTLKEDTRVSVAFYDIEDGVAVAEKL